MCTEFMFRLMRSLCESPRKDISRKVAAAASAIRKKRQKLSTSWRPVVQSAKKMIYITRLPVVPAKKKKETKKKTRVVAVAAARRRRRRNESLPVL